MTHRSAQEILLVVHDERLQKLVAEALRGAGYALTPAETAAEALARAAEAAPELVIAEVAPLADGLQLLRRLRAEPTTCELPVIAITAEAGEGVVASLQMGADDGLSVPLDTAELLARVRARLQRPPVPRELLPQDPQTGLLSERCFFEEVARELARVKRRGSSGCLACVELEVAGERDEHAMRSCREIARQAAALLPPDASPLEIAGRDADGRILLLLPGESTGAARRRLEQLSLRIAGSVFTAAGEPLRLTPVIGHVPLRAGVSEAELRRQALAALEVARGQRVRQALTAGEVLRALLAGVMRPVMPLLAFVAPGRRGPASPAPSTWSSAR